jgi:hypothetical protein
MEACSRLEAMARYAFSQHGSQHNLRIGPPRSWAILQFLILFLILICDLAFYFCDTEQHMCAS